jgi:hypothetical protein
VATNLNPYTRRKWRDLGYYVELTESMNRVPGGLVRRSDLFGFADMLAVKLDAPTEPWIWIQVTSWGNVPARVRKVREETRGSGQWEVPLRDLAAAVLACGDKILVEGWRQDKKSRRWGCRERWITEEDLDG